MPRMWSCSWFLLVNLFVMVDLSSPQDIVAVDTTVSTLTGSATVGGARNGDFSSARFWSPASIAFNSDDSLAVMSDQQSCLVQILNMATEVVSTLGGSANNCSYFDGVPNDARFSQPRGVAYSPDDSFILVLDQGGSSVRRFTQSEGVWDSVVSQTDKIIVEAYDIAIDRYGSFVLITEQKYSIIIKFSLEDWNVYSVICGINGTKGFADGGINSNLLQYPFGIIVSRDSTYALFTDNNAVRKVVISTGEVTTIVGDGTEGYSDGNKSSGALFNQPGGVAFLSKTSESYIVVVDSGNNCLRRVNTVTGSTTTLAGNTYEATVDGTNSDAQFKVPLALAMVYAVDMTDDNNDDSFIPLDYCLVTQEYSLRKATIQYTFEEDTSSSNNGNIFNSAIIYVALGGALLLCIVIFYLVEYFLETQRRVKYKVIRRRIEIRSKSSENLAIDRDSYDRHSDDSGDNEIVSSDHALTNDKNSPHVDSGRDSFVDNSASDKVNESSFSHNHLLGPPKLKKEVSSKRDREKSSDGKVSSPRPTGPNPTSIKEEKPTETESNQQSRKESKSKKSKSTKLSASLKKNSPSEGDSKASFWLSNNTSKSKKEKKKDKHLNKKTDESLIESGVGSVKEERKSISKGTKLKRSASALDKKGGIIDDSVDKANRSSKNTRSVMRSMSSAISQENIKSESNGDNLQREKFEERRRKKLLKEKERLEKIALSGYAPNNDAKI